MKNGDGLYLLNNLLSYKYLLNNLLYQLKFFIISIFKNNMPNCFGFIVLDLKNKKTILVETPEKHLSFPKGKYEKKKDKSYLDCAYRELEEETGIHLDNIKIIPGLILSEITPKGNCNIQYFVCVCSNTFNEFNFDPKEISSVKWYGFEQVNNLPNLKQQRKDVFNNLLNQLDLVDFSNLI
jgi:8-oxo-dGTP pyrophosphatase MutT (NUDIX family)